MHRKPKCPKIFDYINQSIINIKLDKKNTYSANPISIRCPSVHPPIVIHTEIRSKTVLLLHLASRVLAPRTRLATNRSDLPSDLSLNLSEPPTRSNHLFLNLSNP